MVHLYAFDISHLPDPKDRPELLNGIWPDRREKALQQREDIKRKQSAGASLLLRWALRQHGLETLVLSYSDNGKPLAEGICFSLSHSGDRVICAIAEQAVGCDIEKTGKARVKVAKRFFAADELEYLGRFSADALDREFFRLWTMKESYIKMTGEGLRLPLSSFRVCIGDEASVFRNGIPCICRIKEYHIEGYSVSVCSEDRDFSKTIEFVPHDAL